MDVTGWLLRRTPPRPLLLTAPGGTWARVAAERAVRARRWRFAWSPAAANVLVVAGTGLDVTRVWAAMPAPRVRVDLVPGTDVAAALDAAVTGLHDVARQRDEASAAPAEHETSGHEPAMHEPAMDHGHTMHDHDHDHGHDHGHDMAGMAMPGGIPMADRAEDRDGLMLDRLTVPLGPALPLWPAGLTVHTRLQGDVIQSATVETLPPGESFWHDRPLARRLDACARLLTVAGWADAATAAHALRDTALAGEPAPIDRWARRVRRSRTLRWLLRDVGIAPEGDALDRLHRWLDTDSVPDRDATRWTVDHLPSLLTGTELATARLIVASLDPDLDLLADTP